MFAVVTRAPKGVADQVARIPGVASVEARISKLALLDIPNFPEPATANVISLPDLSEPKLNQLYMRTGRTPEQSRPTPLRDSRAETRTEEEFAHARNV